MPTPLPKVGSGNEDDGERIEYAEEQLRLSEDVTAQLRKFTRRHQVTLNTVIQGVWGLLLSRYSGQSDVVFGAVVSGRPAELQGVERMIGLFINTLPVRIQIDKNQMIVDWLRQIQREQVEAREFEYSPLVDIQGWSELPRGTPLFNTLVAFLNYPVQMTPGSPHSAHRRGNILRVERKFIPELTNYPLALSVWPDATLPLRCVYQTVLYDAGTIRRLLSHLKRVLEQVAEDAGKRIWELELIGEEEREKLLVEWNQTEREYREEATLGELFEEQVKRSPGAVAVSCEGEQLSYEELNCRANRIAHYLRGIGVGPEVRVGLCLERSVEMVVSILGVLKAGGAYVPLDPEYPAERLGFMLEDAQIPVLSPLPTQSMCEESHGDPTHFPKHDGKPSHSAPLSTGRPYARNRYSVLEHTNCETTNPSASATMDIGLPLQFLHAPTIVSQSVDCLLIEVDQREV